MYPMHGMLGKVVLNVHDGWVVFAACVVRSVGGACCRHVRHVLLLDINRQARDCERKSEKTETPSVIHRGGSERKRERERQRQE